MNHDLTKIRIKCAEVLGYKNVRDPIGPSGQCGTWWGDDSKGRAQQIPDYPESADAALQLVEWMDKKGNCCRSSNAGHCWWFQFSCDNSVHTAEADTLPLAICLAFLKANGINPETL